MQGCINSWYGLQSSFNCAAHIVTYQFNIESSVENICAALIPTALCSATWKFGGITFIHKSEKTVHGYVLAQPRNSSVFNEIFQNAMPFCMHCLFLAHQAMAQNLVMLNTLLFVSCYMLFTFDIHRLFVISIFN